MSFDEFPPDSEAPRQVADEAPNVPQEASSTDAPPARPTRQRRGNRTGTDAASSANTSEPQTRPRRSRANPAQSGTNTLDSAPESASATPEPVPAESVSSRRPPRQRRSLANSDKSAIEDRREAGEDAPNASRPESSESLPNLSGSEQDSAPAKPAPPKSRRPARGLKPRTEPGADVSTPPEATADEPSLFEGEPKSDSAPPTSTKPRSRRPSRSREPAQVESNESAESLTPPATLESNGEENVSQTEGSAEDTRSGRSRRQRPSRNRKGVKPEIDPASVSAEPRPAESPAESTRSDASESIEGEDGENGLRSRRSRQRNRRGTRAERPAPVATETESPEAIAVVAAPVIVEEPVDTSVGSHLLMRNGVAQLYINGSFHAPLLFFGNVEGAKNLQTVLSEVRKAAEAGVHLHATLIELPAPLSDTSEALDEIDRRLRAILDADPEGYVMPRVVFVPARGWKREYPTDISTYADGATGDPSITSERFWREAEHSLEMLVNHLKEYEWGSRIFGYHLERGEWFQPADAGYDRSMANRDAFRDWLREKYKNSLVALRAAWYDGDVQFHTAEIPQIPPKPVQNRAFYEPRRERRIMDFNEFTSESTAKRLISLATAIKKAANRQSIVSVCYGYTFEFGHGYSGHLALGKVLDSKAIDLLCGPPSYRDRKPGGGASLPSPVDSIALHGKLWLSEDDTKTYLSPAEQDPEDFNPRMNDRYQTEQAHSRAMGRALSQSTGIGFMDLWGEGWLNEDHIWEKIGGFKEQYSLCLGEESQATPAEVVCLIDEKSLIHLQRGEPFFRKMTNGLRDTIQRLGASVKTFLQSDLLSENFPTDAKLYLFLTPYRLTAVQRAAIKEKLHGGNRTLAWLYAPGSCEERPSMAGAGEEAIGGTIGITLRPQEWNAEVGSRLTDARHPITERLNSREIGVRERLNPSYYADPEEVVVLAEYAESGLPSLAVKKCENWQSVFIGDPTLPLDLLRGVCKFAGVHLWTGGGDDYITLGNGWLTIHANRDGHRTLRTPQPMGVYDQSEGRLVGETIREHRYFLKNGMTRTFCIGNVESLRNLGLVRAQEITLPEDVPAEKDEALALAPRPETITERPNRNFQPVKPVVIPTAPGGELSEDMQTLQAILNLDMSQVGDLPLDDLEEYEIDADRIKPDPSKPRPPLPAFLLDGEPIASGRRRRRRGGRGRGRGKEGDELSETEGSENSDSPETLESSASPELQNEVATAMSSDTTAMRIETSEADSSPEEIEEMPTFSISLTPSAKLLAPSAAELAAILRAVVPEDSESNASNKSESEG